MTTKLAQKKFLADCARCPKCDSEDIDHKPTHDGGKPTQEYYVGWCEACESTWTEVYTLTAIFDFEEKK